jgi:glycosyltransferase involved in cell wall biosynthesis
VHKNSLLPISIIIPVYQAAPRLKQHLESLESLSGLVHELIWVITKSPDSSCRLAKKAAKKQGGLVIDVPEGLYPAWNAGLAKAKAPFIYISTVGDVIRPDGLAALLNTLQSTEADVVISPPEMHPVAKETRQAALDWPVFRFASFFHAYEGKKIPAEKAVLMQILSGASSVLGSCASCLFRASVFKAGDFSANHFHYGDTAWAYQHLPSISLTYYPTKVAQFWLEKRKTKRIVDKQQIYQMMKSMSEYLHADQRNMVRLLIDSLQNLDFLRGEKPKACWWLHPSAWVYRWQRQRSRKFLLQCLQRN